MSLSIIKSFPIKSPKATKIESIAVEDGTIVAAGQPLINLFAYEEEAVLSQLKRSKEENLSRLDEVMGKRVQDRRQYMEAALYAREKSRKIAEAALVATIEFFKVVEVSRGDVAKAENDLVLRTFQVLQSGIELEVYSRNCFDAAEIHKAVDVLIAEDIAYVERSTSRLRIKAPASGTFRCYVSEGTPVRIGHLLGEINF